MPAYHSSLTSTLKVGNMAMLPLKTQFKGPAPKEAGDSDIIDEAIYFFKANVFFRNYEIKSEADRTLIYITLYITETLKKLQKCGSKNQALKEMHTLALQRFDIPGEAGFPLNGIFARPADRNEEETMRLYILQIRQETGVRVSEKVFDPVTDKPTKWWLCFAKRRFMDKALTMPGNSY
ncbi:PREDICTED: actin-related protein 2/3 complex subunit 3-like isoform X2 [Priapulus caudatus]|uniref:Actin-related protein 2/3 complex subunit 3 n=1 Tax=Priapulus caudatus TaxID=37621 RepID=A0ABM1EJF3_PRICU|nr:PREDICTED: actin-related protein 2/3 complex subunit 3-like isoform X1 [Priapulus caudatus]XP_014672324.1 PREDICTED: actin-related protein 2/3 complex subunit 3-like isoform X2 [Priapulus caudatus]